MSISRKLISNTIYLFLDWFVYTMIGFFYWFIAGKNLLPEEYGIVSTSVNLAMVLSGVSLLGLNIAVWKLIPEYLSKKQEGKINSLIKFSFKIIILSNIFLLLIFFIFPGNLAALLKIPTSAIFLTGIIILILSLSTQFGMIMYGFQNMKKFLVTDFFGQLTKILISASLIFLGFRFLGPLIGFLIGFLVIAILRFFSIPFKRRRAEKINQKEVMFEYAFPAFISGIAWILFLNGQYVVLTILQNPEITGIFAVAMILTSIITVIPTVLTNALFSIMSQLSINHNANKKQGYLIKLVFRYALFFSLPVAILLVQFSRPVILIFSRSEYLPASQLFPILALAAIIYGCGNIFLSNIYAIGKPKINRNIVILTTLTFLLLAIPLTLKFSALGFCIAYLIAATILASLSFFYIKKYLKIVLFWQPVVKILLSVLVFSIFLYISDIIPFHMIIKFAVVFIGAVSYVLILIPLKFYIKEDVIILQFIAERISVLRKLLLNLSNFILKYT